ncbi:MAG: NADH-quinone oxidoreductase subunit A [Deltaproteobacteria bacterium]|jgi:NADH-quinone oxidoreductase subunit A|nr:NADH-quinone oxidoreductase subunit A [Deltaproteobacteria bacterium]
MLIEYLPILIFLTLAMLFGGVVILLSSVFGRKTSTREKLMTYECGLDPIGNARKRFSVKFFIIAMLFIVFDVEAVFLYPWAIVFKQFNQFRAFIFIEMLVFIGILLVGFIYVWKKGALEWE